MVKWEKRTTLILCACVPSKANELQKTVLINIEFEGLRNKFPKAIYVPIPLGKPPWAARALHIPPVQTASLVG